MTPPLQVREFTPYEIASEYAELSTYWQRGAVMAAKANRSDPNIPSIEGDGIKPYKISPRMKECGVYPCTAKACALPLIADFTCEPHAA